MPVMIALVAPRTVPVAWDVTPAAVAKAQTASQGAPSAFVTRLAWTFMVLSALGVAIALVQGTVIGFALPSASTQPGKIGLSLGWDAWFVVAGALVVCVVTLVVSTALLRRLAWARRTFIGLAGLGCAFHFVAFALELGSWATPLPDEGPADYLRLLRAIEIVSVAYPVVASLLFLWIVLKLQSASVRNEFKEALR